MKTFYLNAECSVTVIFSILWNHRWPWNHLYKISMELTLPLCPCWGREFVKDCCCYFTGKTKSVAETGLLGPWLCKVLNGRTTSGSFRNSPYLNVCRASLGNLYKQMWLGGFCHLHNQDGSRVEASGNIFGVRQIWVWTPDFVSYKLWEPEQVI